MSSNSASKTCSIDSSCCEFPLAQTFRKAFCLYATSQYRIEQKQESYLTSFGVISGLIACHCDFFRFFLLDTVLFMAEYDIAQPLKFLGQTYGVTVPAEL